MKRTITFEVDLTHLMEAIFEITEQDIANGQRKTNGRKRTTTAQATTASGTKRTRAGRPLMRDVVAPLLVNGATSARIETALAQKGFLNKESNYMHLYKGMKDGLYTKEGNKYYLASGR
jgi:hypothetical protein